MMVIQVWDRGRGFIVAGDSGADAAEAELVGLGGAVGDLTASVDRLGERADSIDAKLDVLDVLLGQLSVLLEQRTITSP